MIRLTRGPLPAILERHGAEWTHEYLRRLNGDATIAAAADTRYRHPEIKEAVLRDSHDKCVYCESRPRAVSPGDVEHVQPKAIAPERILAWDNLVFSCTTCNTSKGTYWSVEAPLLDPYHDEPAEHLSFVGPMAMHRTPSGELACARLRLNRASLLERRVERLEEIAGLLRRLEALPAGSDRAALEAVLVEESADDGEYAAAVREYVALVGGPSVTRSEGGISGRAAPEEPVS
jgi:uncharacterized protein (TIGR02646 family)